jgi:hypothetical protein
MPAFFFALQWHGHLAHEDHGHLARKDRTRMALELMGARAHAAEFAALAC